jgi:hypothetical protein
LSSLTSSFDHAIWAFFLILTFRMYVILCVFYSRGKNGCVFDFNA